MKDTQARRARGLRRAAGSTSWVRPVLWLSVAVIPFVAAAAGAHSLISLDGDRSPVEIPELDSIQAAAFALDPDTDLFYQVGYTGQAFDVPKLFVVDGNTGAHVRTVPLTARYMALEASGDYLFGMLNADDGLEVWIIDPETGDAELRVALTDPEYLRPAGSALAVGSTWWQVGATADQPSALMMFRVPVASIGPLARDVQLQCDPVNLATQPSGAIFGLAWTGGLLELLEIDAESGAAEALVSTSGVDRIYPAAFAYDGVQDRFLLAGFETDEGPRLLRFDAETGSDLGHVDLEQPVANLAVTSLGHVIGIASDGALVPALLVSHETRWADGAAEIRWTLSDRAPGLVFTLQRRSGDGPLVDLPEAELIDEGASCLFRDATAAPGATHVYRVNMATAEGSRVLLETTLAAPARAFALRPNSPNPFNPTTTIAYTLDRSSRVRLRIVDVNGRDVRTLVDATQAAGAYSLTWDGRDEAGRLAASGVYFSVLESDVRTARRKMLMLK